MWLERYAFETVDDWEFDGTDEVCVTRHEMLPRDYGEYYRAADVDALLARIRAAVEAWMMAPRGEESCDDPDCGCWDSYVEARAALDALLADGGA